MKASWGVALVVACLAQGWAQQKPIDPQQASRYFAELKAASSRDAGHLWGHELYGPVLFVDPETRFAVANRQDSEGKLSPQSGVFAGQVPPELGVANTAVKWAGVTWTMVMWPLPENRRSRIRLMAHECFHRIQPALRLNPTADVLNSQLDTRDGRIWLQLEFRALERALWSNGPARQGAITDAFYFRVYRRSLFPGSGTRENALETNEGLAEYTGVVLGSRSAGEEMSVAETGLHQAPQRRTFVRSFAYATGPAYGYLLDRSGVPWRPKIRMDSDLAQMTVAAYKIPVSPGVQSEAMRRAEAYDGDEIIAWETDRAARQGKIIADARARLIDGPLLVLPLRPDAQYTFDPNSLVAIDDNVTLYPTTQVTDAWGILRVENGALLIRNHGLVVRAQVSAPKAADSREGDGWKLELKPGWKLGKGQRAGDWTVAQEAVEPKN